MSNRPPNRWLFILLGAALASPLASALASGPPDKSTVYQLRDASALQEGCLDPCACPVLLLDDVTGGFSLVPAGMDGSFHLFDVVSVSWTVRRGEEQVPVTGAGTYRIDPAAGIQRLELDLVVGLDPTDRFDSGLVDLEVAPPAIVVPIAMNEFFCYDRVFELNAEPTPIVAEPGTRWGALKTRFFPGE